MAKRLEGKPFHLLATHCQSQPKDSVVAYIKSKGLPADTPNMTVSSFGGHPSVKGNGYVPYYMVFNHKGELAHHHMCGDYHGGDGLRMIELVDELLAATPAIFLGETPYVHIDKLAQQVARKRGLTTAIKKIEAARAAEDTAEAERAEYDRLHGVVASYRDRMLANAAKLSATQPSEVVGALKDLAKELKGTALGTQVSEALAKASRSKDLKAAIALEKKLKKIIKALEKREDKDSLTDKSRAKAIAKMGKLLLGDNAALPFAATIKKRMAAWAK